MKRILSVLMILVMILGLVACATVPGEDGAAVGEFVSGSSQDVEQGEGPQKVEHFKGDDATPGGDDSTPGGDDAAPGGDDATPGGDDAAPGGDSSGDDDFSDDEEEGGIPENALVFGTFNIKRFFDGKTAEQVCAEVLESGAHIIGFQEVSNGQTDIGGIDQTAFMAEKCGYKYFDFCPAAFDGQYGTCILSKYPIKKTEHVSYATQTGEHRKYGRYVIDVDGTEIVWYNTHLATQGQDDVTGPAQFQELMRRASDDAAKGPVVISGDFNLYVYGKQKELANRNVFLALNGGESMDFTVDYPRNLTNLDNIYVSKRHFEPVYDNNNMGHVKYIASDASDHDILWGYVVFKK